MFRDGGGVAAQGLTTRWRGTGCAFPFAASRPWRGVVLALTVALTAIAADAVPTVDVSGVVLDTEGQPADVELGARRGVRDA